MLNQPTSSPIMKTMFGFFPDEVDAALAAVVSPPPRASNTVLVTPSEQPEGRSTPRSVAPVSAADGRTAGVAAPARDEGARSLVAATTPSNAPSPTHASD